MNLSSEPPGKQALCQTHCADQSHGTAGMVSASTTAVQVVQLPGFVQRRRQGQVLISSFLCEVRGAAFHYLYFINKETKPRRFREIHRQLIKESEMT